MVVLLYCQMQGCVAMAVYQVEVTRFSGMLNDLAGELENVICFYVSAAQAWLQYLGCEIGIFFRKY